MLKLTRPNKTINLYPFIIGSQINLNPKLIIVIQTLKLCESFNLYSPLRSIWINTYKFYQLNSQLSSESI